MLACIRCGACLNVCPVYRRTGGAAYGPVYSGPMGAVLVPLLAGLEHAPDLPHASSLCGACTDACPVKIPLHELLLELRRDLVEEGVALASRAPCLPALVACVVVAGRLSGVDPPRPARRAVRRSCRARAGSGDPAGRCPSSVAATGTRDEPPRRLSSRTPRLAGFTVHRRRARRRSTAPACRARSTASPTPGSVVLAASPEEPRANSLLPGRPRHAPRRGPHPAGARRALRGGRRRPPERARDRHRPEPERGHRADARRRRARPRRGARRAHAAGDAGVGLPGMLPIERPQKIVCIGLNYSRPRRGAGRRPPRAAAALREMAEHADRARRTDRHPADHSNGGLRSRARRRHRRRGRAASRSRTRSRPSPATSA